MRKRKGRGTAARLRAAVLLLLAGCLLPSIALQGRLWVPERVEELLVRSIPPETASDRIAFVRAACGLVGKVGYFWGGKSRVIGWDGDWGRPRRVTAPGSDTTGHIRSYGLDCSGLVSWAAAMARRDPTAYEQVGEGVREQYANSIPTQCPLPGDLAFFPDLSHVGIVLGRDETGTVWVVHSSSSLGGVVVTPGTVGFTQYGIPQIFSMEKV